MRHLLFAFISLTLALQAAKSEEPIGDITESKGTAEVLRDTSYVADVGFDIMSMDDVRTGNGRLKINFIDGSELSVTEQSQVVIDEFIFDPDPDKGKMAVSFLSGTARFATSKAEKISKKNISINTPTAQVSVRGTDFTITVDEIGRSLVILLPDSSGLPSGEILVATGAGSVVLNKPFQSTVAYLPEQVPTAPVVLDLTVGMIDSMLIVNPPQETVVESTEQSDSSGELDSSGLDIDLLEPPEEDNLDKDLLEQDYLSTDFLFDTIDVLIDREKEEEQSSSSSVQIKGTIIGDDKETGFNTEVRGNKIYMTKTQEGQVGLILDAGTSYKLNFELNGNTFDVSINGGNNNTINIRQSQ